MVAIKRKYIRVVNGLDAVEKAVEEYMKELYRYNSLISKKGYYLKPLHIVTKPSPEGGRRVYHYIGRYWWRIEYVGKKGKTSLIKWIYVGREKPKELHNYPNPPPNPLSGLRYRVEGRDIIVERRIYSKYEKIFRGYRSEEV